MKIVHICLTGVYTEGWSYQENLLSKYHKRLGYDVTLIASEWMYDNDGNKTVSKQSNYVNPDGIKIIQKKKKKGDPDRKFRRFPDLFFTLSKEKPNILFVHGCQFLDVDQIVKYKRMNPKVVVYVDNHADFSNSATNWISRNVLHRIIWKKCAKKIEPYTRKFYGVMPSRVDFLIKMYGIPKDKVELLVMGADDEKIDELLNSEIKTSVRNQFNIDKDDFLVVTGGKIDLSKKQTLLLMQAVNQMEGVKLLVFGSVVDELKKELEDLCSEKVKYIGWINSSETNQLFAAADLVAFPGRHSVFWEQVAGMGIPLLVKDWKGTHHVDVGGNVKFIKKDTVDEIRHLLIEIINNDYDSMRAIAQTKGKERFSYRAIAKRSIS